MRTHLNRVAVLMMLAVAVTAPEIARSQNIAPDKLAHEVSHQILLLPDYTVFDYISFQVQGSMVTLMGKVTKASLKDEAEKAAQGVQGVTKVVNQITMLPVAANDDRIRLAVYRSIYGIGALERYALLAIPPIHILAEGGGRVTLEGVVETEKDKTLAKFRAQAVAGVFPVINNLRVEKK